MLDALAARSRQALRLAGFCAWTGAWVPLFVLRSTSLSPADRDRWVRRWARGLLRIFGITVLAPPVPAGHGAGRLIVANHRSAIDIGVLLSQLGGTMVARDDLARWPIMGPGAAAAGTIFVDRAHAHSGALTLRTMQHRLAAGQTVAIFPEGTTFEGDEVRAFHRGGFVAALAAHAEVLPVGLAYAAGAPVAFVQPGFAEHLAVVAGTPSFAVAIRIGHPLRPLPGERAAAFAQRAQDEVQRLVIEARRAVDTPTG